LTKIVNDLGDAQANAGCNDLHIPDSPESRELISEYYTNYSPGCEPSVTQAGTDIVVNDDVLIYLLKRELGLLN
jgi:hypothetical protein